jgi:CRISPR-associated protein (TIGR03986 family)
MGLPEHKNPGPGRTASAPYNFVPLPEAVIKVVDGAQKLPNHNTYANTGYPHTGYFEVTLTTKSPLYIRCSFTLSDFLRQERGEDKDGLFRSQVKNTPDFFYTRDPDQPVIPGSSLRGMLRNLLEIVSYGKIEWITEKRLFFRTVDDTAVGRYYRGRMTGKVEAGFLQRKSDGYVIKVTQMVRVPRNKVGGNLYEGQAPNKLPRWNEQPHQWLPVWVQLSKKGPLVEQMHYAATPGWHEGRLIITGDIPGKKKEFVFLLPSQNAEEIAVPAEMLERFHDDQLTQWQERAFPKNQPGNNCRERDGMLRQNLPGEGDPVFFLRENGQLTFFGRAQMFRLPYKKTPRGLVLAELRTAADIDYADALFGYTKPKKKHLGDTDGVDAQQGEKARAYASRVFVMDGKLVEGQTDLWFPGDPIFVPRILATPKPTAFQHYLTQQEPNDKNKLDHYDSPPFHETTIRGHKRYWHQGLGGNEISLGEIRTRIEEHQAQLQTILATERQTGKPDTQHTQFKPLKPNVEFRFRVYFENLSDAELGALCWTLHPLGDPTKTYCHNLGMGKPLGMGAVQLDATLHLTDRVTRYGSLFDGDDWRTGAAGTGEHLSNRVVLERCTQIFEQYFLDELKPNKPCTHLSDLKRIGILLKMLEWEGRSQSEVRTLELDEFRQRKVLPDPSASEFGTLTGYAVPTVASGESSIPPSFKDTPNSPHQEKKPRPDGKTGGTQRARMPKSGEPVPCVLLGEKTKKGGWKAKLKGAEGVGAILLGNEPPDLAPGQEVELIVQSTDPKNMSFRWPKRNK